MRVRTTADRTVTALAATARRRAAWTTATQRMAGWIAAARAAAGRMVTVRTVVGRAAVIQPVGVQVTVGQVTAGPVTVVPGIPMARHLPRTGPGAALMIPGMRTCPATCTPTREDPAAAPRLVRARTTAHSVRRTGRAEMCTRRPGLPCLGRARSLLLAAASGAAMAVAARAMRPFITPFVAAPIAVVVYGVTLWLSGGIEKSQMAAITGFFTRKFGRRNA